MSLQEKTSNVRQAAILFSNRAAASYKLSQREGTVGQKATSLLESSLEDGQRAVETDSSFEKGYLRLTIFCYINYLPEIPC